MGVIDEVRCPTCSRPLLLRSGPAITPLRLEQLTLFALEPLPPESIPVLYWSPRPAKPPALPARPVSRRRRRAWLPRLVRWVKARAGAG